MKPLLSICCITYNHEKYIADALESFLMQETTFPYEIIVHDDASTDKTADIIKEYEKKYPNKIKPIYQKENQFSKGKKITFECVIPHVTGSYIAFCEGDDYWSDKNKIQKQIEFLEIEKECSSCFHGVEVANTDKKPIGRYLGPVGRGSKEYAMRDNIRGGVLHISSLVIRSDTLVDCIPEWAFKSRHGDYALAIIASANGKVYYIDEIMSVHRVGVENSMMTNLRKNYSKANDIAYHKQRIKTLREVDEFYGFKFNEDIKSVINDSETKILLLNNEFKKLFSKRYRSYFREKGLINIMKFIVLTKTPKFALSISLLKGKIILLHNRIGREYK